MALLIVSSVLVLVLGALVVRHLIRNAAESSKAIDRPVDSTPAESAAANAAHTAAQTAAKGIKNATVISIRDRIAKLRDRAKLGK